MVRNLVPHYPGEPTVLKVSMSTVFRIVVTVCLGRQPKEEFIVVQSLMVPSIIVEQDGRNVKKLISYIASAIKKQRGK